MGEYIMYKGELIKIGTCENLYYSRYETLRAAVEGGLATKAGGNLEPGEYLNEAKGFRYRFPFPDEDKEQLGGFWDFGYNRGLVVPINESGAPGLCGNLISTDWSHYRIHEKIKFQDPGYRELKIPVSMPCPYDTDAWGEIKKVEFRINEKLIRLVQQKQIDKCLWVVVDCFYCHAAIRLPYPLAQELMRSIEAEELTDWQEINRRIEAGYQMKIEPVEVIS